MATVWQTGEEEEWEVEGWRNGGTEGERGGGEGEERGREGRDKGLYEKL